MYKSEHNRNIQLISDKRSIFLCTRFKDYGVSFIELHFESDFSLQFIAITIDIMRMNFIFGMGIRNLIVVSVCMFEKCRRMSPNLHVISHEQNVVCIKQINCVS